jgi:thiosulfate dehydrogenase (quinone) large subunit
MRSLQVPRLRVPRARARLPGLQVPRVRVPRLQPAAALLPLRLFLGATFVYAGVYKLSDPGFLATDAPTYIGTQLEAFANGTPGGVVLRTLALPFPQVAGVGVALLEIAVGLLAFFGLLTRLAATAGLGLSLLLVLTATWKTRPYFLGSDIVFVFAWLPFVLAGARGQLALENLEPRKLRVRRRGRLPVPQVQGGAPVTRRAMLRQALGLAGFTMLTVAGGAVAASTRRSIPPSPPPVRRAQPGTSSTNQEVALASALELPPGEALPYPDPADGRPDILIRQEDGRLTAFSAVCTHAGCEVLYRGGALRCPCHGGVFNAETGAVESGPPPLPLEPRQVAERDGTIYALPSA